MIGGADVPNRPDRPDVPANPAQQALRRDDLAEAERLATLALKTQPQDIAGIDVLARVRIRQQRTEEAIALLMPVAENPALPVRTLMLLGNVLWRVGEQERSRDAFGWAVDRAPEYGPAWMSLCMTELPFIYDDEAHVLDSRRRYEQRLDAMAAHFRAGGPERLAQLFAGITVSHGLPFRVAYQGMETRALQAAWGQLVAEAAAARFPAFAAPPPPRPAGRARFRLGIVSGHYKEHSVWKIPLGGFVYGLDRSRFELIHYHLPGGDTSVTLELARLGDTIVAGPKPLPHWLQKLRADRLDAILFPEFGMDGMTASIAAFRLAPLQCQAFGHPDTTGLPTMDYGLTSALMEPPDGDDHYTERLVRLPGLSYLYERPQRPYIARGRADFGLEADDVVYWCGHQVKKLMPRSDDVFARIAEAVPKSRFVFINWAAPPLMARFRARMDRAFARYGLDFRRHCRFLDRLPPPEFDALLRVADVFLDGLEWNGNNSTQEALAQGLPVITCPGRFMRGRHSRAILTQLGLTAAIVDSKDALVALAIRLGGDPVLRQALRDHIRRTAWRLCSDRAPVDTLQDFLLETGLETALETGLEAGRETGLDTGLETGAASHAARPG